MYAYMFLFLEKNRMSLDIPKIEYGRGRGFPPGPP